jgi:hypothetical protein
MHIRPVATLFAALLLIGCEPRPEQQHPPGDIPAPATRADLINDTIVVEGMAEPATARLLQSPEGAPIRFSTYVPEGIHGSFEGAGDTLVVRFAAAFTGTADPNAYMHVRFYAPEVGINEAREILGGFLATRVPEADPIDTDPGPRGFVQVDPPAWGQEAFSVSYRGDGNRLYVGQLVIATRRDRVFHVLTHYPAEFGDGLAPRFDRILDHWRWDDTGTPLRGQQGDTAR